MASTPGSDGKSKVPVPAHFSCPVSMELMVDPVMVVTGHTYDRPFIQRWLESGNKTCPVTGIKLRSLELTPNFALRMAIQDWATANGIVLNTSSLTSVMEKAVVNTAGEGEEGAAGGCSSVPHSVIEGHDEIVWAVEATARHLFSASADKTIRVWDTTTRRCLHVLEEHTRPVLSLAVSERHAKLFSGSYDCSIRVWDLNTYRRVKSLHGHTDAVRALAVCGDVLFSGSYDSTVRAFDINTLKPLKVLEGHTEPVRTLAVLAGKVRNFPISTFRLPDCCFVWRTVGKYGPHSVGPLSNPGYTLRETDTFLLIVSVVQRELRQNRARVGHGFPRVSRGVGRPHGRSKSAHRVTSGGVQLRLLRFRRRHGQGVGRELVQLRGGVRRPRR